MGTKLSPIHPGEILLEDFLNPLGISQYRLAQDIKVPPRRINEIVHGLRGISADTAMRLAHYFGTTAEFWMNLQSRFDLETLRDQIGSTLVRELKVYHPAADSSAEPQEANRWNESIHFGFFQSFFAQKEYPLSFGNLPSSESTVLQANDSLVWRHYKSEFFHGNAENAGHEQVDNSQGAEDSRSSRNSTKSSGQKGQCIALAA